MCAQLLKCMPINVLSSIREQCSTNRLFNFVQNIFTACFEITKSAHYQKRRWPSLGITRSIHGTCPVTTCTSVTTTTWTCWHGSKNSSMFIKTEFLAQRRREQQRDLGKHLRGARLKRKILNFDFWNGAFWCTLYFWSTVGPSNVAGPGETFPFPLFLDGPVSISL